MKQGTSPSKWNSVYADNQKKLRKVAGLSQESFAALFSIKSSKVGAIEEGRQMPSIHLFLAICKHFELDPFTFVTEPYEIT